jgi:hypothetical protein
MHAIAQHSFEMEQSSADQDEQAVGEGPLAGIPVQRTSSPRGAAPNFVEQQQGLLDQQHGAGAAPSHRAKDVEDGPLAGIPVPRTSYGRMLVSAGTSTAESVSKAREWNERKPRAQQAGRLRAPMHDMRSAIRTGKVEVLPVGIVTQGWLRHRQLVRARRLHDAIAHIQELCAAGCVPVWIEEDLIAMKV